MDGAARTLADLASELALRGAEVTVLTWLEHAAWPSTIRCRGANVERLPKPAEGVVGRWRHRRRLAQWLRTHADRYNLVYVSGMSDDAATVLTTVARPVPVVLRAEKAGPRGDCFRQIDVRGGRRLKRRCMKAAALVAPNPQTLRELVAAGYPRPRIHHIPHGVRRREKRSGQTQRAARAVLAESSPMLDLTAWAPLAVYTGRLHVSKSLDLLVAAWRPIVDRWPNARLWLAGEGPEQAALASQIEARGLSGRVLLVGMFDQVDALLDAADLFVSPAIDEEWSVAMLEAMASGLPIVTCNTPSNRELLTDGRQGLLVPPGDAAALGAAIARLVEQPELAAALGDAAKAYADEHFPLAKSVDAHISLFDSLL